MEPIRVLLVALWAAWSLAFLAGCSRDQLAEPARDHSAAEQEIAAAPEPERRSPSMDRPSISSSSRRISGRPMWADSRRYTAEENAAYQFGQHGEELDSADLDDFLAKAHRFVNDPPAGAKTLVRANGDRLLYDPDSGLFGVARSDGAPRTVFKPADGAAYWAQQVREIQSAGGSAPVRSARPTG